MGTRQKKLLSVFLTVSSIMGIVAPAINANATPIEDELNSTAEELKEVIKEYSEKLVEKPNFANHHRVNYAAERLEKYDAEEARKAKEFIAQYDSQVFTKEVVEVITKMDTFSKTKNMQLFDELLNVDIPALEKIDSESADYLKSRLDVWGQAVVFDADPNYAKATDEIIKVQTLREEGKLEEASTQVGTAKEAIGKIATLELNGPYLEAKLKVQEDLVNEEIAKQDLYVREVVAVNGRQIFIVFNRPIDKDIAKKKTNFEITPANSDAKSISIDKVKTGKNIVRLDVSGLNNKENAKYLVKVKDVANVDGKEMEDYGEIVNLYDDGAPTVESVEYNNVDKQIDINFSEPISNNSNFFNAIKLKLDGANVNLKEDYFDPDEASCSIYLSDVNLAESKNYNIEINGLTDFAGNALEKYTGDILIAEDNEDPKVDSIDVLSRNVCEVAFNETVKDDDFKILIDGKDTGFTKDGCKIILDDTLDYKEGNKLITIYDYEDVSGNKGDSITKEVYFEPKHPVLDSPDADIRNIGGNRWAIFTFDRDLQSCDDFTVKVKHENKDGITITDEVPAIFDGTDLCILITGLENGDYRFDLEPSDIIDIYGQKIEKTSLTFTNDTSEKTARVTSVQPNDQKKDEDKVIVKFDTDLGEDAKDPSNYTIDGVQVFESAIFKEDKKTVELTLKEGAIVTTGEKTFKIEGLKNVKSYEEVLAFQENVKPEISKAEVISYNKIKLTMSDVISSEYTIDKNDLKVRVNDTSLKGDIVVTGQGTDTLIITLSPEDTLNNSEQKVTIEVLEDNTISDLYGNTVKSGLIEKVDVKLDSLFDTASEAVENFKNACNEDLTVKEKMDIAEAAKKEAKEAVAELNDGSVDKGNLEKQIEDYEAKIKNVKSYLEDAEKKIKALEEKAVEENLLTVKEVDEAYALIKPSEDAVALLKDTSVEAKFTERIEPAKKLITEKKAISDEVKAECEKLTLDFDKTAIATSENPLIVKPVVDGFEFTLSVDDKENFVVVENGNLQVTRSEEDKKDIIITVKIEKGGISTTKNFKVEIPTGEGAVIVTPEPVK